MSKFSHNAYNDADNNAPATDDDIRAMTIPRCFLQNSQAKNEAKY